MCGAQEKSEGAHQKNFGRCFAPALCPPPHLQIASDATAFPPSELRQEWLLFYGIKTDRSPSLCPLCVSVIFVNENENENYQKRKNNDSVNEN